jgi:glycosyltransferase involved in cell wall biosynthesis
VSRPVLVSCVIPVFNGERYLGEALGSVLRQSHSTIEIVVVDDGSTDSTPRILAEMGGRITSLRQANAGPSAARNLGIQHARGEYIAFLDADDLWLPHKTEAQLRRFERNSGLAVCTSLMQNFWAEELAEEEALMKDTDAGRPQPGPSQTLLVRKDAFHRVGLFDPSLLHRDTHDWMFRARAAGLELEQLDEVLVCRRLHASNRSRTRGAADAEELFAILQKNAAFREISKC